MGQFFSPPYKKHALIRGKLFSAEEANGRDWITAVLHYVRRVSFQFFYQFFKC
ncbi:hypothetical protein K160097B7_11040 [[Clostridium] hylemonae]